MRFGGKCVESSSSSILETIRWLEERLLTSEVRSSPVELASLIADDFVEFGMSGHTYDKKDVLADLPQESGVWFRVEEFQVRLLATGVVLATYRSFRHSETEKDAVCSLRSSVWKRESGGWRITFHQGTPTGVQ